MKPFFSSTAIASPARYPLIQYTKIGADLSPPTSEITSATSVSSICTGRRCAQLACPRFHSDSSRTSSNTGQFVRCGLSILRGVTATVVASGGVEVRLIGGAVSVVVVALLLWAIELAVGVTVGLVVGLAVGVIVGLVVGLAVGVAVEVIVGWRDGCDVGVCEGPTVGVVDGVGVRERDRSVVNCEPVVVAAVLCSGSTGTTQALLVGFH